MKTTQLEAVKYTVDAAFIFQWYFFLVFALVTAIKRYQKWNEQCLIIDFMVSDAVIKFNHFAHNLLAF